MSIPNNYESFTDDDVLPAPLRTSNKQLREKVEDVVRSLLFTKKTLKQIREVFEDEMRRGLLKQPSSLQMENTYIPELPDGTEEGRYLALDLGGTNFRVILIEFQKGKIVENLVEYYHVPDDLRLGRGEDLFDFLADCIMDFALKEKLDTTEIIPLGFTFSFPMVQHSLKCGVLVTWTKSFNCADVVGKDAVAMLNDSLKRRGCSFVEVPAVLNDTTGTLMMGAIIDRNTSIGLILGTGSNACYLEKIENVPHWETERHDEKEVIIDIEWGAFGDNGALDFIKTDFDKQVDDNSLLVHSFTFEKYISGKYLGEIVRVILVRLVKENILFGGKLSNVLNTSGIFTTEFVSKIEEDVENKPINTANILKDLRIPFTNEDIDIVQYICRVASNRSALLVSTCLASLLDRMGRPDSTIAIDGSLCEKHPKYRGLMERYMSFFTPRNFRLEQVTDGSGMGAAVAVAIAVKLEKRFAKYKEHAENLFLKNS